MSLIPLLYSNWWEDLSHPHSLIDQHFGHGIHPDHLPVHPPLQHHGRASYFGGTGGPSTLQRHPAIGTYVRPWAELFRQGHGGTSTVKADKDQFQVVLDVQQFAPEEINVKVVGRTVVVEGKHEEKEDQHGWVSRKFSRRYIIPEQCDIDQVASNLSTDGVLTITVPRKDQPKIEGERSIKIQHTGKPAIRENGQADGEHQKPAKEAKKK